MYSGWFFYSFRVYSAPLSLNLFKINPYKNMIHLIMHAISCTCHLKDQFQPAYDQNIPPIRKLPSCRRQKWAVVQPTKADVDPKTFRPSDSVFTTKSNLMDNTYSGCLPRFGTVYQRRRIEGDNQSEQTLSILINEHLSLTIRVHDIITRIYHLEDGMYFLYQLVRTKST